jgi:hypothetical protein
MFKGIINSISTDAIVWFSMLSTLLYPDALPVILFTGMLLMFNKEPNFMDLDRVRYVLLMKELEAEEEVSDDVFESENDNENSNNDKECTIDDEKEAQDMINKITSEANLLREEIRGLKGEIEELKKSTDVNITDELD